MSGKRHHYTVSVTWTGNRGSGTADYRAYDRDHTISAAGKPAIAGSSDPAFRGRAERWNPEELLVAAVSACHKLWYLHLCAAEGISVLAYDDEATGEMVEDAERGGWFTGILLKPRIRIGPDDDRALAMRLHDEAHHKCFIANSVNFPVRIEAEIAV